MPTPMWVYADAAAKWGGIDPKDDGAVDDFFVEKFPLLPKKTQEEILSFLLGHDGMSAKRPTGPYTPPDPLGVMKGKA